MKKIRHIRNIALSATLASECLCSVAQAADLTSDSVGWKAFQSRTTVDSTFYRIPFLLETSNGTLIAGTDANRGTTGDSADNTDAAIRRKIDVKQNKAEGGWQDAVVPEPLNIQDFSTKSGYARASASVIDGAIVQDRKSKSIKVLIDLWAWNGGVFSRLNVDPDGSVHGGDARRFLLGDGFAEVNGRPMLLLSTENRKGNANGETDVINNNTDRSAFHLVADVEGQRDSSGRVRVFELSGTPAPYSAKGVDDSNLSLGELTSFSLDDNFVLYKDGKQLQSTQVDTKKSVPMKIFIGTRFCRCLTHNIFCR